MRISQFILVVIFLFSCSIEFHSNPVVKKVRADFYEIALNSARTEVVLNEVKKIENPSAVIKAYEAALEAMMARVVWNPINKLKHVRKSQKIFEEAVKMDDLNVEVRFIRFAVEYNIPRWLGFSKNLQTDKDFIMDNLSSFDLTCITEQMLDYIKGFLKDSGWYSISELEQINALQLG